MKYTDKIVIITGGSKGIGKGCVEAFVAAAAKVVFCARHEAEGQALAEKLTRHHQPVEPGRYYRSTTCLDLCSYEGSPHCVYESVGHRRSSAWCARKFGFAWQHLHTALAGSDRRRA